MRKFLIALSAVAAIAASALVAYSAPRFNQQSGCAEASQLLNCLNQAVAGAFGVGSSGNLNVTITPAGTSGLASVVGVVTAANTAPTTANISDAGITGGSMCLAQVMGGNVAAGSAPYVASATPSAGLLTVLLANSTNVSSSGGSNTITIGFWCFQ